MIHFVDFCLNDEDRMNKESEGCDLMLWHWVSNASICRFKGIDGCTHANFTSHTNLFT